MIRFFVLCLVSLDARPIPAFNTRKEAESYIQEKFLKSGGFAQVNARKKYAEHKKSYFIHSGTHIPAGLLNREESSAVAAE